MPPLTLCAYMKKGPNLRWSLIQCSGGDEGDRTPDLLTASQALSQLSYAPVRRSTIRELGRRCKDNFGKTFRGRRRGCGTDSRAMGPRCPTKPAGRAPREGGAAAALPSGSTPPAPGASRHETGPSTTFGRHPPTMAPRAKIKPQADGLRFSRNTGYGRGVGVKRSRWAGFVAGASRMTAGRRLNVGTPADSGQILLSLISEQARHVAWPVEKPGGPSGIRTQNPGIMSPLR